MTACPCIAAHQVEGKQFLLGFVVLFGIHLSNYRRLLAGISQHDLLAGDALAHEFLLKRLVCRIVLNDDGIANHTRHYDDTSF